MLRLERLSKIYPTGEVLKDITWELKPGERIGLVGVNGAGKSTQLQIIAGLIEATDGLVIKEGNPIIAYLKQEFDVDTSHTVREELFQAFGEASVLLAEQKIVEKKMQSEQASNDDVYLEQLISNLSSLQRKFESLNGYELEAKVEKILPRIGFNNQQADQLVGSYSGGWQMRIALGKILLQEPDILLLDEPTNHLDLEAIEWLEKYLINQKSAIVVISHDRAFLDSVCTQIVNIENGISRTYLGNYSSFLEQKEIEDNSIKASYVRQQKELAEQQYFIDRFRASANRSSQAKSREKNLEKIDIIELPTSVISKPRFKFNLASNSGKKVAFVEGLTHAYGENILFLDAKLEVNKGDRIAFIGPNGSGKSTLLKMFMGLEKPFEGIIKLGIHNIIPGYFEQNQAEVLDLQKTVIDTLFEYVPTWNQTEVRSLLGNLGLKNDAVFKEVNQISGGEKARLALALLIVKPCNLLILDEPTNHLDISSKQMLEEAILEYKGSLMIVSHDRYFISKVANTIVEIRDGQLILYRGNYDYYKEKKEEERLFLENELLLAKKESKRRAKREKQRKKSSNKKKL